MIPNRLSSRPGRVCSTLLVAALLGLGVAAYDSIQVAGEASASESEADEGYFAIGQETTLLARPGSDLHKWMRSHIGQRLRITVQVDADTE